MKKYEVELKTLDMEKNSKPQIIELEDDEKPTPKNIINKRFIDYYTEHGKELGLKTALDIVRAAFYSTSEIIDNLVYYKITEVK